MAELAIVVSARNQAASVLRNVQGDLAAIGKQAKSVSDQLRNTGKSLSDMGRKVSLGVSTPILGMAGAAVKAAADYEQLEVSFTTMLGSAERAKGMMEELSRFAAQTPFESPEIQNASKMLLAFGVEAKDIIPTMTQLGDISAGLNIPLGEMAYLFGTTRAQGRLFTADLNQFTSRGIPMIKALAETMGVAESDVKALVEAGKVGFPEVQAALASLTDEGGQFAGLMEAQSGTLSGLFSTMKDNIGLTLTTIGQQIIETFDLKDKLKDAIAFLEDLRKKIDDIAKNNPELFRMGIIFGLIALAVGPALIGLGAAATALAGLGPAVGVAAAAFGMLVSPLGLVVLGLAALTFMNFDTVSAGIQTLADAIGTFITTGDAEKLKAIGENLKTAISNIDLPTISDVWNAAKIQITTVISTVDWTVPQEQINKLKTAVGTAIGAIDWADMGGDAGQLFNGLKTSVQDKIQGIDWSTMGLRAGELFAPLKTAVGDKLAGIDWATLPGETLTTLQAGATTLKDLVIGAITDFEWSITPEQITSLQSGLASAQPVVDQLFGETGVITTITSTVTDAMAALSERLQGVDAAAMGQQFSAVVAGASSLALSFSNMQVEAAATKAQSIIDLGTSVLGFLADFGSGLDVTTIATSLGSFATNFSTQLGEVLGNEEMLNLGEGIGKFAGMIVTKIGDFLGTPGMGEDLGEAAGGAASTLAKAAMNIVTGITGQLATIDWVLFVGNLQSFTSGFLGGVVTALAEADFGPVATAMAKGVADAMIAAIGAAFPQGLFGKDPFGIGMVDEMRRKQQTSTSDILRPTEEPTWMQELMAWKPTTPDWLDSLLGWRPSVPDWVTNLMSWKPAVPAWVTNLLAWRPGTPGWVTSLLGWRPSMPDWVSSLLSWVPGGTGSPPATNASGTNYFRGGLSWVGEQGPELVWAPRGSRIFSNTESMQLAGAGGGVTVVINANVASDIDMQVLAYRVADIVRRRR